MLLMPAITIPHTSSALGAPVLLQTQASIGDVFEQVQTGLTELLASGNVVTIGGGLVALTVGLFIIRGFAGIAMRVAALAVALFVMLVAVNILAPGLVPPSLEIGSLG